MLLHFDRLKEPDAKTFRCSESVAAPCAERPVRFCFRAIAETRRASIANPENAWSWTGVNGLASPLVWWAILLIIASFITWLYVLRFIPLSIAFPLSRVVDAMVPLGCWIFLGEAISTRRWVGIALVIVGLAVIARPVARLEEEL